MNGIFVIFISMLVGYGHVIENPNRVLKREILFTPQEFLYTPHITHNLFLHSISLMGCLEKFLGCK